MILISLLWKNLTVAETLARVESADADQLMTWSERILNATTVEKNVYVLSSGATGSMGRLILMWKMINLNVTHFITRTF